MEVAMTNSITWTKASDNSIQSSCGTYQITRTNVFATNIYQVWYIEFVLNGKKVYGQIGKAENSADKAKASLERHIQAGANEIRKIEEYKNSMAFDRDLNLLNAGKNQQGSVFQGAIKAPYGLMVNQFGEPINPAILTGDTTCNAAWVIKNRGEFIFIYNNCRDMPFFDSQKNTTWFINACYDKAPEDVAEIVRGQIGPIKRDIGRAISADYQTSQGET